MTERATLAIVEERRRRCVGLLSQMRPAISLLRSHGMLYVSTGLFALDDALRGGFPCGLITEVCGNAGSGKTRLLVSAAITAAGARNKVVYVSTACLSDIAGVMEEMIRQRHGGWPDNSAESRSIQLISLLPDGDITSALTAVEHAISAAAGSCRLVVFDSITDVLRLQHSGNATDHERHNAIATLLCELKRYAEVFDVAVVLANTVITTEDRFAVPSFGPLFFHGVNNRIFIDADLLSTGVQMRVVKSPAVPQTTIHISHFLTSNDALTLA